MSATSFLQHTNQVLYVLVFLVTLGDAIRSPRRASLDVALFFGDAALIVVFGDLPLALHLPLPPLAPLVSSALLMALPYLLLRLVDDLVGVPPPGLRAAEVGLALAILALILVPLPWPGALVALLVASFVAQQALAAFLIVGQARRSVGVTRRRMQAIALGSAFLGLTILAVGLATLLPTQADGWALVSSLGGFASGLAYVAGFAPPPFLRRAWQAAGLRTFLGLLPSLSQLGSTRAIARELEKVIAETIGSPNVRIGLWVEAEQVIRFADEASIVDVAPGQLIAGRAFANQRPIAALDAPREDPPQADFDRAKGITAVLAAPITAGQRRLGVLVVDAARTPFFADDDLALVQILAAQAAVVLENRLLIDEAAAIRAREEATRLKDDFLSAAAHDLKTPLTTLLAQAQLLERRARQHPDGATDLPGIQRIIRESRRLNRLVLDLLDVARVEHNAFLGPREQVDLVELAREATQRNATPRHAYRVEANEPVEGWYDRVRLDQLLDNLFENAVKFSPEGGEIVVKVASDGVNASLSVSDSGIGIPPDDLPHVFERFRRGTNVDDRHFAGMGLGLFICQQIVEQHGGRIWARSAPGQGTTIEAILPLGIAAADAVSLSPSTSTVLGSGPSRPS